MAAVTTVAVCLMVMMKLTFGNDGHTKKEKTDEKRNNRKLLFDLMKRKNTFENNRMV